jgi:hypothetical protein
MFGNATRTYSATVIPAKAGIQCIVQFQHGIPAFAGMTGFAMGLNDCIPYLTII